MATPESHALLSASSAHRWLHCTAAPRFEAQFPKAPSSRDAAEGTLAHSICELFVNRKFASLPSRKLNAAIKKLREDPLFSEEMLTTAEVYTDYLNDKALSFPEMPFVATEVKVDFSHIAPQGFGTCDCVMVGADTLHITDYKHGKGVPVSAKGNPQMRLYALGALRLYSMIYGDRIRRVSMAICQPRLHAEVEEDALSIEELIAWGESIKPIAQEAFSGTGRFVPGDHCRFCRGRSQCRARAEIHTALEDFKDCVPVGSNPKDGKSPCLSDAEIGDLLMRGKDLVQWYNDLQEYALGALMCGRPIPGYKVVEGRSIRAFDDADTALELIEASGVAHEMLYDYKAKSLSEIEKLMGKKAFAEVVGDHVIHPAGKPTLAVESDKRPSYSSAEADFAGVSDG